MNIQERNQMAMAYINGNCSACKDCIQGPDCTYWVIQQILQGKPYKFCDYCGEPIASYEPICNECMLDYEKDIECDNYNWRSRVCNSLGLKGEVSIGCALDAMRKLKK